MSQRGASDEGATDEVATPVPGGTQGSTVQVEGRDEEAASASSHVEVSAQPTQVRWVIADGRRCDLETEPAKSNMARTHTLQGVAERLRERVAAEGSQLARLQEEVESASGARALDAVRLWYLDNCFLLRVRYHADIVCREIQHMRDVRAEFDNAATALGAGCPAVRLIDDVSSSDSGSAAWKRGDSWRLASASEDLHVSEAEEAYAMSSGSDSTREAAEEVAVAMAAVMRGVGLGGVGGDQQEARRFSPVQWSRDRFDKIRAKDSSSSSNLSDSLPEPALAVHQAHTSSSGSSDASAALKVIHAAVEETEVSEAMEVFRELQRQYDALFFTLRQHGLLVDGVLRQAGQRSLHGAGAGDQPPQQQQQQQQQPPPHQQLLLQEVALLYSEMVRAQMSLTRIGLSLQRVESALPPAPTMAQLPPPPAARTPRRGLAWFSAVLRKRFSRTT